MRDWDLIQFGIFCDSIRSVGFDSRILASCGETFQCFRLSGECPPKQTECLNSRGSTAAAWNAATAAGRPKQL